MFQKLDWELLPRYYVGENEPVGIWIERNFDALFLYGHHVTKRRETIEDAIQDVASKLCSYEKIIRSIKFKPTHHNIRGALWVRLRNRLIDIQRSEKKRKELNEVVGITEASYETKDSGQELFEARLEKINLYQKELPPKEQEFLNLMQKHGFGKLKPIMKELRLEEKEARKIKQRIVRKIKRHLLIESKKVKK